MIVEVVVDVDVVDVVDVVVDGDYDVVVVDVVLAGDDRVCLIV